MYTGIKEARCIRVWTYTGICRDIRQQIETIFRMSDRLEESVSFQPLPAGNVMGVLMIAIPKIAIDLCFPVRGDRDAKGRRLNPRRKLEKYRQELYGRSAAAAFDRGKEMD